MLKVKNKKMIRNLARKSFRASRTRNIIAVIAIALTSILFTTLLTMGIGTMETLQYSTMKQSGGSAHGAFKEVTQEQYDKLGADPLVAELSQSIVCADRVQNPEFLKRHLELWYNDETGLKWNFHEPDTGRAPEAADEIMMDTKSLDLLGIPHEVGQKVELELLLKPGEEPVKRTFTLCGLMKSSAALDVGFGIVSKEYVKTHAEELVYKKSTMEGMTGQMRADVKFKNTADLEGKLHQVIENCGYSTNQEDPNYIASNPNWAYLSTNFKMDPTMMLAIAGGILLVVLTGYLIIYNIFQISVIRDIRFYGLLKTIGTTGKQIKSIIRRQAFQLSAIGIPIGLVIGFLMGKAIIPMVMARTSYGFEESVVSLDPKIFIGSILFALLTVFISTQKPARIAAKVSPVEAVRYTDSGLKSGRRLKKSTDGGKLPRMALSNMGRNKKRTVLVILSLSLSLVLLNCVFTVSRGFDMDKYLSKFTDTDFLAGNAVYFGMDHYSGMPGESTMTESMIQAVESQPSFEEGGRIFGSSELRLEKYDFPDSVELNEDGEPYQLRNGIEYVMEKDPNGHYFPFLYGLEDLPFSRLNLVAGETDWKVLKEKLATGNYLIEGVNTDDHGKVVWSEAKHEIGQKITLYDKQGTAREYEIIAQTGIKYYTNSRRISDDFVYYTTADQFRQLASPDLVMTYAFNVSEGSMKSMDQFLKQYTTAVEPMMDYESKLGQQAEFESTRGLFLIVGGVLTVIIGMIGILNFINSILTSIVTRRKEFAMLQSIGMTGGQLKKMLMLEGLYYALGTMVVSLALGILFSGAILPGITGSLWFFTYQFILWPLFITWPALLVMGAAVPVVSLHFADRHSIVERLRETE